MQRHQNLSENQAGISVYEVSNNHGFAFGGHNEETRGSDWKEVWGARIHMKLSICMQFCGGQTVHAYCNETKKMSLIVHNTVQERSWSINDGKVSRNRSVQLQWDNAQQRYRIFNDTVTFVMVSM